MMSERSERMLGFTHKDVEAAIAAITSLRRNPAYTDDADELLAGFFERHADLAKRDGRHPEALLWRLRALTVSKTKDRAASLAALIGNAFARRAIIARSQKQSSETSIDGIRFIDLSSDGRRLLTVSDDNLLRLLLTDSRQLLWQASSHKDRVCSVALRRDGLMVVTGVEDSVALLWRTDYVPPPDNPKKKQVPIQLGDRDSESKTDNKVGKVGAVAFSPDGQTAIIGSDDGMTRLWAVESGHLLARPVQHEGAVISVGFSPSGKIGFSTSTNGTLCLWQADSGKSLCEPIRHKGIVWALAFSPDERVIVTGCDDGAARLWRLDSGKMTGKPMKHTAWVSSVAFSPDGQIVLSGSADGTVRLWHADSGQAIGKSGENVAIRCDDSVKAVAFSPDGKTILAVTTSWLHAARFDGKETKHLSNNFLCGLKVWGNGIRVEDSSATQVKLVVGSFPDSLRILTLRLDQPDAELLQGDPEAALIEWQNILGLSISESGKIEPLDVQRQTRKGGITVTDPTGRTFISYRRTRVDEIALLIAALQDRGVPTWQDLSNLGMGQAEENLRKTLGDPMISGGILWLTPDVADSEMIRKVELPLILNRARNDEAFFAVPVAAGGLDFKGAAELGKGYVPYDLGEFNITKVAGDPINHAEAAKVARLVLRQHIEKLHRHLPDDAPLVVNIYTGTPPPFQPDKALIIDWTQRFVGGRTALPGAWEDFLLPALKDIVEAIQTQAPERAVEATGRLSIPAAVALGCIFLEPRGIKISWRPQQALNQFWHIKAPRQTSGFVSTLSPDTLSGEDLAVLVSVDNNINSAFTRSRGHLAARFRAISEIINPGLAPGVTRYEINTAGEAADIAWIVRQAIINARNKHPEIRRTHLFMAVPIGLAMMIGQLMNTCGMIQTYEFNADNHGCPYQPAVLLNPTW
jgi:WD40 repeat protein